MLSGIRHVCKAVLAAGLVLFAVGSAAQAPDLSKMDLVLKSVPDGPVAKVGEHNISKRDFVSLYESELGRLQQVSAAGKVPDGDRVELGLFCLGTLIERELLLFEARERGLTVERAAVEKAWAEQVAKLQEEVRQQSGKAPTEQEVIKTLGFSTRAQVFDDIARFLMLNQARAQIIEDSGLSVTDGEVAEAYEIHRDEFVRPDRMHLKQIFFPAPARSTLAGKKRREEALGKLQDALARIQSGQRFEGVARAVSPGGAERRGRTDLGLLPISEIPPFLVEAASSLAVGEVSGAVSSEFGYHIVKLEKLVPGSQATLAEVEGAIRERLLSQRGQLIVRDYCDTLIQDKVIVTVFLELEKTLATHPEYRELKLK